MIWSGVFETYEEAAKHAKVNHVSERWKDRSLARLSDVAEGNYENPALLFSSNPLLILGPLLDIITHEEKPCVLDFGGNLGQLHVWAKQWLGETPFDWVVVERNDFLIETLPKLPEASPTKFCSQLNELPFLPNLMHFGSSIQYVADLSLEFSEFLKSTPPQWITIADFMGSDEIETFYTLQRYEEGHLISCFRSTRDITSFFESHGYELKYSSGSANEVTASYYPELDLPEANQIDIPRDLIFKHQSAVE